MPKVVPRGSEKAPRQLKGPNGSIPKSRTALKRERPEATEKSEKGANPKLVLGLDHKSGHRQRIKGFIAFKNI
jgi:hypothetical protein